MTPYEVAKVVHRDLSSMAPRLAAALNRALVDIGEGSILVGLGPGRHRDDTVTFQEKERIELKGGDAADILARIQQVLMFVANHSCWQVLVDKTPSDRPDGLNMVYTLIRAPRPS